MWELGRELIAGGLVSSLDETAAAVRMLAERARVVAEGAGALSLAAALAGRAGGGRVVCIVSGGNIDSDRLRAVLAGETPGVAT
jgi:threonine dehydratase